jgi:signal peptidase I
MGMIHTSSERWLYGRAANRRHGEWYTPGSLRQRGCAVPRSHLKNTMQARLCELRERGNTGRKRAQACPLRYSEHVFSRRRRDLVAQRAAAQGIFEMASSVIRYALPCVGVLLVLAALLVVVQTSVMQSFYVPSSSMSPTLRVDDCIVVPKFTYGLRVPFVEGPLVQWGSPERGAVVVFYREDDPSTAADEAHRALVKRVIGVAGDTVTLRGADVFVNGELLREPYVVPAGAVARQQSSFMVPEGELFVLGDNRYESYDSRFWSEPFVPVARVLGPATAVYWSAAEQARLVY